VAASVRSETPSARAEASAQARSRSACSKRHAALDTRRSTRRSRRQEAIRSVIVITMTAWQVFRELYSQRRFVARFLPTPRVVWYRTVGETHNADGKYVAYLDPGHRSSARLRQLDPDLYERLASVVASGWRSTAALAGAGVLGAGTCFFGDLLDLADLPVAARAARQARRRSWVERALAATADCDLIFADPDNGIRAVGHPAAAHRTKAVKHAYLDELAAFIRRGQSLIVYHHADRSAAVDRQARGRLADLARGVPVEPVAAVRASRGTSRLFLVAAATPPHAGYLAGRLSALQVSPWGSELKVYWPDSVSAGSWTQRADVMRRGFHIPDEVVISLAHCAIRA